MRGAVSSSRPLPNGLHTDEAERLGGGVCRGPLRAFERQDARVRPSNWRWDAEWTASVVRNEKDFTVEMALPFASFDFDPNEKKDLYVVPMRVYRHDRTDGATAFFSWLGMDDLKYERFGVWHLK